MTGSLYGCEGIAHLPHSFNRRTHIIEEYTGLIDIKGNRIFEGDIVRQKFGRKNHYSNVIWDSYGWYIDDFPLAMFDEPTITCIAIGPNYSSIIDPVTKHLKLL